MDERPKKGAKRRLHSEATSSHPIALIQIVKSANNNNNTETEGHDDDEGRVSSS